MRSHWLKVAALLALSAVGSQSAFALDFNFRVASWNTSHSPTGTVITALFPASGASVYRASLVFHRGTPPTTRIVYDVTNRIVTLHYPLAEFPVVSNLLEQSSSTYVNFSDTSGTPFAYLYTNHAP